MGIVYPFGPWMCKAKGKWKGAGKGKGKCAGEVGAKGTQMASFPDLHEESCSDTVDGTTEDHTEQFDIVYPFGPWMCKAKGKWKGAGKGKGKCAGEVGAKGTQ